MTIRILPPDTAGARKIKVHKKSRKGCSNCKLRSVKCDEVKPSCKRCISYGVSCSYSPTTDESLLHHSSEVTTIIGLPISPPYFPDSRSELLAKFRTRTALTVTAGGRLPLYQNEIVALADSNAYLMNSILALTLLHDYHLSGAAYSSSASFDSKHYTKAIYSFSKALSQAHSRALQPQQNVSSDDQAALWTTGAMIGTIVFCNIDATDASEAWPLRPASPSDLDWLKMNDGKKSVYMLTQGLANHATYKPLVEIHTNGLLPPVSSPPSFDRLPAELLEYLNIFDTPSDDDRVYHPSIRQLARVYDTGCSFIKTILMFWTWCAEMTPQFRQLLEQKQPRALLMLAFWWAEIYQTTVWWLVRRARLEGMAICLFLDRHYWKDQQLIKLVQYPKAVFEAEHFHRVTRNWNEVSG